MKKVKKALLVALTASMCLSAAFAAVACGSDDDAVELKENTKFDTLSSSKVSEAEWKDACKSPTNVTMKTKVTYDNENDTAYVKYDGTKFSAEGNGYKYYYDKKADGSIVNVHWDAEAEKYYGYACPTTDPNYTSMSEMYENSMEWKLSDFEDSYKDFKYSSADKGYKGTLDEATVVVKFSGKKLAYVKESYEGGSTEMSFYNYGSTTVTIPEYTEEGGSQEEVSYDGTYYAMIYDWETEAITTDQEVVLVISTEDGMMTATLTMPNRDEGTDTYTGHPIKSGRGYTCEFDKDFGTWAAIPQTDDGKMLLLYNEMEGDFVMYVYRGVTPSVDAVNVFEEYLATLDAEDEGGEEEAGNQTEE